MIRLVIDRVCCLGLLHCGMCESVLPGLFKCLDDQHGLLISSTYQKRYEVEIYNVMAVCPMGAIGLDTYSDVDE